MPPYLTAMNTHAHTPASNWFPKKWHEDFATDRGFKENETWVEEKRRFRTENGDGDHDGGVDENNDISIVMLDHEGTVPSRIVREVVSLCRDYHLGNLENGKGEAGHRRAAWLDDRITPGPNTGKRTRKYQNPLTATGLFKFCREKVEHRQEDYSVTKIQSLTERANSDLITKRCKTSTDVSCKTRFPNQ